MNTFFHLAAPIAESTLRHQPLQSGAGRKPCTKCHVEKPLAAFTRDATRRDGHEAACKECRRQERRAAGQRHYRRHSEKVKADMAVYRGQNRQAIAAHRHEVTRKKIAELEAPYIVKLLSKGQKSSPANYPQTLVDLKREHIAITRLTNELNAAIADQYKQG